MLALVLSLALLQPETPALAPAPPPPAVEKNVELERVLVSLGVHPILVADVLKLDADSRAGAPIEVLLADLFRLAADIEALERAARSGVGR